MYSLIKLALFASAFFAFLIWLYRPIVLENPGVAAYQPPPATRLVPLPRKMDAPELVETPSADRPVLASVADNGSRNPVIQKTRTRAAKPKQSYPYRERAIANERYRAGFREWSSSRYNSWF